MCNVIIEEELYSESFVKDWTRGFEEFSRYVQHFSPDAVESITGVPADTVRLLARRIAEANGASPVMYSGLEYSDSGVQAIRATHVLWALAGQLDVPGGRCFTMKDNHFPLNRDAHVANPDLRRALGRDRFPIYSMYRGESHAMALPEAVLQGRPYAIRSLIILGGSIITAWPEPSVWKETLNSLDFLVCIDRQLTADAAYADIVLPATTMYEIESYMTYGPIFRIREKVIDPPGEARNDFLIMAELARRLGYGDLYPQSSEALLRQVLSGSGFTHEDVVRAGGTVQIPPVMMQYRKWEKGLLRPDGIPGFDTPSGKFEIASVILEEHGYDPLPVYSEPAESPLSRPDLTREFPLVFNSGARVTTDFRSQHHGIPGLNKDRPEPTVTISIPDAESRGIVNGDLVQLKSTRGGIAMRALVTDDIVQGTVEANMGGGGPVGPEAWQKCNINELTALDRFDPISGFPVYKALLCDVVKIKAGEGASIISSEESSISDASGTGEAVSSKVGRIYLDHNATTPLDREVREAMITIMKECPGNPSSIYKEGREAKSAIDNARRGVAQLLNCTARRIIFTGSGSEANNHVIKGVVFARMKEKDHIITSSIEHPSVLGPCRWLEKLGCKVTYLPADSRGKVDPSELASAITGRTALVSVMTANNETGVIQPVSDLARIARKHNVPFHTDATQTVGKIPLDVNDLGVDLLTMSAHKIYGPKGVGALYIRKGLGIDPILHGGNQESGMRAGTENVPGITGMGRAAELAIRSIPQMDRLLLLRDRLEKSIRKLIPGSRLNGDRDDRLPNTLSMVFPGMRGESMVMALDQKGVCISSGSACRSGSPRPSETLLAMGLTEEEAHCTVRISLGLGTTDDEIDRTITLLNEVITETRNSVRFAPCR
jgi:cysteine desulfurase NifS